MVKIAYEYIQWDLYVYLCYSCCGQEWIYSLGGGGAGGCAVCQSQYCISNLSIYSVVVCNLYPFEDTISKDGVTVPEAVEQIDIGKHAN